MSLRRGAKQQGDQGRSSSTLLPSSMGPGTKQHHSAKQKEFRSQSTLLPSKKTEGVVPSCRAVLKAEQHHPAEQRSVRADRKANRDAGAGFRWPRNQPLDSAQSVDPGVGTRRAPPRYLPSRKAVNWPQKLYVPTAKAAGRDCVRVRLKAVAS